MFWSCQVAVVLFFCAHPCETHRLTDDDFAVTLHPMVDKSLVIGLCGGISSGKSTVRQSLGKLGAMIVDADVLGHDSYAAGTEGFASVKAAFNDFAVADGLSPLVNPNTGEINRKVLGALVFNPSHPERLEILNNIVWPIIGKKIQQTIAIHRAAGVPLIVVEAAVLLEAKWEDLFDEVWTVDVNETTALKRLIERSMRQGKPLSETQAQDRINKQKKEGDFEWRTSNERVSVAISNGGSLEDLKFQIAAACLRRMLPLPSCLPESPVDEPIHRALLVAPLSETDHGLMDKLGSCVTGTKSQPGQLVRVVIGDLGHVSELSSTLGRMYAAGASGACSTGHRNTNIDVLLDYLQPPKSVTWLANLLAGGLWPVSGGFDKRMPPLMFGQNRLTAVNAVAPRGIEEIGASHSAVGGTFDHLHAGHKALLTMTAVLGMQRVTVGVTSDAMAHKDESKSCANMVQSETIRQQMVLQFLSMIAPDRIVSVVPIDDPWGPTAEHASISVLVASTEFDKDKLSASATRMRNKKGLPPMRVETVPLLEIPCATPEGPSKFGSSAMRLWLYGDKCQ